MYVPPYPRSRNETATHSGDYVPPSLINDFAFCPHGSLILLVPFCQQTAIIYPYSVQKLVVIMKTVNCEEGRGFLNITWVGSWLGSMPWLRPVTAQARSVVDSGTGIGLSSRTMAFPC
jgi:hypothetical protein